MRSLVLNLLDVMRLRTGPQSLPSGWGFTVLFSLLYLSQGFLADQILQETESAPRGLVAVSIQFLVTYLLLNFRRMNARLPQTITALAGTGVLFGAISIILMLQARPGNAQPLLALVWLAVFLWSLAVDAHIYRQAMSTTMSVGILIAVLIFGLNFIALEMMFST